MKKIGLLSDLHLESSNLEIINPGWDILVIAGDLSANFKNMLHFFSYYAPVDIPIIYVLGNHEYEGKRLDSTVEKIKELLMPFENVFVLDNECKIIDGIKFIGTTLWSNFELDGLDKKKEAMNWVKYNIVDFTYIFEKNNEGLYRPLTPETMLKLNDEAYKFLNFELKNNPFDGEKIVVSHFAPHKNSVHKNHKHQMSSYWVNHLEELMGFSKYWFHGHTHNTLRYTENGTEVICNPRGNTKTFNMATNPCFDKQLIIPIDINLKNDVDSSALKIKF